MTDLFNCEYTEEIDVFKVSGEIQLAVPYKFRIIVLRDYGYIYLRDEQSTHWAFAKNGWEINIPNFYCHDLPIGKHIIGDEIFIRVSDDETLLSKIKKYLAPYILSHIWKKDVYYLIIN